MVEITIYYENGQIQGFKASGHAGYAKRGKDIYCAGVSAVTGTALVGLQKHLSLQPDYEVENGWLECKIPKGLTAEEMSRAQIILSTMEAGLRNLQDTYPQYIKVFQGGADFV